jgi:hypothetical protein
MSLLGQYEYIINKSHPRANADGAVYMHVIVAEEKLGRYLLPEEVVHHKDLNKLNNNPDNLMIFASNSDHSRFHANGCNENILSLNENGVYACEKQEFICIDCGEEITRYGVRCKKCAAIHERKVKRPTQTELFNMILNYNGNFTKVAKEYGVSDNAVRKWCDSYSLSRKSRDYKI